MNTASFCIGMAGPIGRIRSVAILLAAATAWVFATQAVADDTVRFVGDGSERTPVFETGGPWLLDWRTTSDFPWLANFEMRLHDGASGEFIGTVIQLDGTGNGLKLFENGGEYRLTIVANNVNWELEISEVSKEQAAAIERRTTSEPSLQELSRQTVGLVREGSFESWRAVGDDTLLLFASAETGWRATFRNACPGLENATALSFVTPSDGRMDVYDSILLDDGIRCYFDRVVPTIME